MHNEELMIYSMGNIDSIKDVSKCEPVYAAIPPLISVVAFTLEFSRNSPGFPRSSDRDFASRSAQFA